MRIELIAPEPTDPEVATITVTARELRFFRDLVGNTTADMSKREYGIDSRAIYRALHERCAAKGMAE